MAEEQPTPVASAQSLALKDYVDFLQRGFAENMAHARHQETLRGVGLAAFMALATAIITAIGLIAKDPLNLPRIYALLLLGLCLLVVGAIGAVFAQRSTNRYQRWRHVALSQVIGCNEVFRQTLGRDADVLYQGGVDRYRADMRQELGMAAGIRVLSSHKTGRLWVSIMLLVALMGLGLAASAGFVLVFGKI